MSGYYPGPGYRDQFTPAEEREMEARQRHEEETEGWVTCPVCNGHGLMQGDGGGWDGSNYHSPGCDHCDGQGAVPADAIATKPKDGPQ